jgi:hypothetical protein
MLPQIWDDNIIDENDNDTENDDDTIMCTVNSKYNKPFVLGVLVWYRMSSLYNTTIILLFLYRTVRYIKLTNKIYTCDYFDDITKFFNTSACFFSSKISGIGFPTWYCYARLTLERFRFFFLFYKVHIFVQQNE